MNFTATNYDGDYANFYYVIQENTSSIITQSNNTLQEKNVVESYIEFSNGTQNLLNVGHTTVTLENIGEVDKRYVLVIYTLDIGGGAPIFSNSGRLNRYLYNYSGGSYMNTLPSWNHFGGSTLVTNASFSDFGSYYTYFYDGYIYYTTNTTKYFGVASDDDSFLWVIKGDRKWSSIGHSNSQSYTWIASNIPDATLVCDDRGNHGITGSYLSLIHI